MASKEPSGAAFQCQHSRKGFLHIAWIWTTLLIAIAASTPSLIPSVANVTVVQNLLQRLPRATGLRSDEAVCCYSAFMSTEFNTPGINCNRITVVNSVLTVGPAQIASADGTSPEVQQVGTDKAVLCYHASNNKLWCMVVVFSSGVLVQSVPQKMSANDNNPQVRAAIVPIGNDLAVVCFRDAISTICNRIDATGSVVIKGGQSAEVSLSSSQCNYLALAPTGSSKAVFCYSNQSAANELTCHLLNPSDALASGNFTSGAGLAVLSGVTHITMAQSDTDTVVACYFRTEKPMCRALQVNGASLIASTAEQLIYGQAMSAQDQSFYPPSIVQINTNTMALCYVTDPGGNFHGNCKAIHNLDGSDLSPSDIANGVQAYTSGASNLTMAKLNMNLAIVCIQEQDLSLTLFDTPIKCKSLAYPRPCSAPVGISNAPGPCNEGSTITHGSSCSTRCGLGYDPSLASLSCLHGILVPPTFTCLAKSCNTAPGPANGNLGNCGASLASGAACQPSCNFGYRPSGTFSCDRGNLFDMTCEPAACTNLTAPTNGNLGSCTRTLPSGHVCQPECDAGYESQGNTSCKFGSLKEAQCTAVQAPVPVPAPSSDSGAAVGLTLSGSILFLCCCACCCVVRRGKYRHVKAMAWCVWKKDGDIFDELEKRGIIDGHLERRALNLEFGFPCADIIGRMDFRGVRSRPFCETLEAQELCIGSRIIVCFSHYGGRTEFVKRGIEYLMEQYSLDISNFVFQDRLSETSNCTHCSRASRCIESRGAPCHRAWRWQWLIGVLISRRIICVVDPPYTESLRCCNEYLVARQSKKSSTLLLLKRVDIEKIDSVITPAIHNDSSVVEWSYQKQHHLSEDQQQRSYDLSIGEAFDKLVGDMLGPRASLALRIRRKASSGKNSTASALPSNSGIGPLALGIFAHGFGRESVTSTSESESETQKATPAVKAKKVSARQPSSAPMLVPVVPVEGELSQVPAEVKPSPKKNIKVVRRRLISKRSFGDSKERASLFEIESSMDTTLSREERISSPPTREESTLISMAGDHTVGASWTPSEVGVQHTDI